MLEKASFMAKRCLCV